VNKNSQFEKIRAEVAATIEPVKPLAGAWKRGLLLPVLFGLLVGLVLLTFGTRDDYAVLGPWYAWGFVIFQCLAAYTLVTLGLRITIPGLAPPSTILAVLVLLGFGLHYAVSEITFQLSPNSVEDHGYWQLLAVCFSITVGLGLVPLVLFLKLASKGLAQSATTVGFLCGLGSGLCGEAAWRMHCYYTEWGHILPAHTGAILMTALLGAMLGFWWRKRSRNSSHKVAQ
jgi:hypothetical protein